MAINYRATLRGDRLEWDGEPPGGLPSDRPVVVYVTIAGEEGVSPRQSARPRPRRDAARGKRMAAALEKLAAINAMATAVDPAAWQHAIREDRPLPDRDA